jgi:photosystem II stability/assembly factor-like uncharacterized protein
VKDASRNWVSISLSSTGAYQTALESNGYIYRSTNYGNNWAPVDSPRNWTSVAVSSTGQYQTAVGLSQTIYKSSDYGASWTSITTDTSSNSLSLFWFSVALSSSGQYQIATSHIGMYLSSNYGVTWSKINNTGANKVAISSSGAYITFCGVPTGPTNPGIINVSTNYGATFTATNIQSNTFNDVAMSESGQYQIITDSDKFLYISSNYGVTWSTTTTTITHYSVDMSVTGQYIIMFGNITNNPRATIQFSSNFGNTWTLLDVSGALTGPRAQISMSGSGDYVSYVYYGGQVNICNTILPSRPNPSSALTNGSTVGGATFTPVGSSIGYTIQDIVQILYNVGMIG